MTSIHLRTIVVVTLGALGGCRTLPVAPSTTPLVAHADASPQAVLTQMQADVIAHGWRIIDAGPDSLCVDFGISPARIAIPDDHGATDVSAPLRSTEVHATALCVVRAAPGGAAIVVHDTTIYWHPDLRCWLPCATDLVPSAELLRGCTPSGTQ